MKITKNMDKALRLMNNLQKETVLTQWKKHGKENSEVDFDVSGEGDILKNFALIKGVWNPFLASGRYHARYLFYHSDLFYGKDVIEIGVGSGIMSVVMAKYGAKNITASDVSSFAVENTKINAEKYGLKNIKVVKGNLFENVKEKADLITWMIPFFAGYPEEEDTIGKSMIMPPELFERFLEEAKNYLKSNGVVLIPSFSLGGDLTDPRKVAKNLGYKVTTPWTHSSINGIQQGAIYMHELRLE
ncbi:methyltransferase [archaeon]|jgi:release factor glutamine methyltransferase|nr:methyltransferase [archaeon]MBT3730470.1 methyltransferase [archaeon]MBT4670453.1 methyltransferase [archaeon]MBT5030080.1 methyltransferase [archaeon]MBT5288228.1 methyltransferase [archaeon]